MQICLTSLVEMFKLRFLTLWTWSSISRSMFGIVLDLRISRKREKESTLPLPWARKSGICYRIAIQRMFGIMTLTYIFNVMNFAMWIFRKQWELERNAQVWLYRGYYSPSNSIMANVVLRDIDPHCQCRTFYCDALFFF